MESIQHTFDEIRLYTAKPPRYLLLHAILTPDMVSDSGSATEKNIELESPRRAGGNNVLQKNMWKNQIGKVFAIFAKNRKISF